MFYKTYKGRVGISLPPEISLNKSASRSPNCAPFHQLASMKDAYKFSFCLRTVRTCNSVPLSVIAVREYASFGRSENNSLCHQP